MKILQIINSLNTGGAEKLVLETLPQYYEKGIDMDVLVLNGSEYPFMKELKRLTCCNIYSLGLKSVYNPFHIFKIIPYFKKYDLVHVHLFPAQYWVVLAKIISFSKIKLIFTEHSTSNRRIQNRWLKLIDRFFYKSYHQIICITQEVSEVLKEHTSLPENKFKIINNGVAIEKFKNATTITRNSFFKDIEATNKLLIQVSSFQPPKDQATLIKSMQYLSKDVRLLLVGDGVLRKDNEDLVAELQLKNRVLFLGLRMDVPQLLKSSDISILSSEWEGFGLVAVEGMASGKPFIGSDVPGLSNVVKGAGILFEPGNAKELAQEIEKLLSDDNYYQSIADACQLRAEQYNIKIMVEKHIKLYYSL
jgi:glycosyltransferase involved in cell wall biosynthesis